MIVRTSWTDNGIMTNEIAGEELSVKQGLCLFFLYPFLRVWRGVIERSLFMWKSIAKDD